MPSGVGDRFGAPPRFDSRAPRFKAPGLGGSSSLVREIPAEESASLYELESTTPEDGFSGILSRSRFVAVTKQAVIGHGGPTAGQGPQALPQDPGAGRSQFTKYAVDPQTFVPNVRTSALDRWSEWVEAAGFLKYFRRTVDTTVPGFELQDPNAMGWGKDPPRAWRSRRYTLRPEFQQGAQNFLGLHTKITKGARMSTSPVRMGPARSSRLTDRAAPGSYGQKTKVL